MYAFWAIIISNAAIATILAIGAMLLGRIWKNAAAVHLLWVVVLLKLFTPPLFTAELPFAPSFRPSGGGADRRDEAWNSPAPDDAEPATPTALAEALGAVGAGNPRRTTGSRFTESAGNVPWSFSAVLAAIWIGGAGCMAAVHAARIRRFAGVIRDCEPAPSAIRTMVIELSSRLGLSRVPGVRMTSRALPPLVWSIGISPRVILPCELFARLDGASQGMILAHELVHIRRRDHVVRLLELAASTVFWWHPVVWWASRQLRELEERCCDGRVLEILPLQPRTYAAALVDTWEFLSEGPRAPVPLRTAIHSTGSLSRRIRMLTCSRSNRLSAPSATLVAALAALPLAVAFSADPEQAGQPRPEGQPITDARPAIVRGRVTDEADAPLADVRVRVAIPATDMRFVDTGADRKLVEGHEDHKLHKLLEARSDARGDYRLEIPGIAARTVVSIDAIRPGYHRSVGFVAGGEPKDVEVAPGTEATASLVLKPALYISGVVVDQQEKPVPGVEIEASVFVGIRSIRTFVEQTVSRADGTFELFNYSPKEGARARDMGFGSVFFSHPDYIRYRLKDVYALPEDQRVSQRVVLDGGHKLAGTVFDAAGKPVPHAMVEAICIQKDSRKATMTDANGKFALRGLTEGQTMVNTRALDIKQKLSLSMVLNADKLDLELRLQPMPWPAELKSHAVLGMQLADVTPELKAAYDLYHEGALILDPGKDFARLDIGQVAEGNTFVYVGGRKRIHNVREFVNQILAETAGQNAEEYTVFVAYTFSNVDAIGTSSRMLKLKKDDLKQLKLVSDQLKAEPH
jgi:beta-lactamase regulating signal transducer with metallopeptidase domain